MLYPSAIADITVLQQTGIGNPRDVLWTQDGKTLIVGGEVGIWFFDVDDMNAEPRFFDTHEQAAVTVTLSPDETLMLTIGSNRVRLWDVASGTLLEDIDAGDTPAAGAFSPDGTMFAITKGWIAPPDERGIYLYATDSGRLLKRLQTDLLFGEIQFLPDNETLLTRRLREYGSDYRLIDIATDSVRIVHNIRQFPLALVSHDTETIHVFDVDFYSYDMSTLEESDNVPVQSLTLEMDWVTASVETQDNKLIAFDSAGLIRTIDLQTLEATALEIEGYDTRYHHRVRRLVDFSPDNRTLAMIDDEYLKLVDVESGAVIFEKYLPVLAIDYYPYPVLSIHPDNTQLATVLGNNKIGVWDVNTGDWSHILSGHTDRISKLYFSSDGFLYTASEDGTIRRWNTDDGSQTILLSLPNMIISSFYHQPGTDDIILALCNSQGSGLHRYSLETGQPLLTGDDSVSILLEDTCFTDVISDNLVLRHDTYYLYNHKTGTTSQLVMPDSPEWLFRNEGILTDQALWLDDDGFVEQREVIISDATLSWGASMILAVHEYPVTAAVVSSVNDAAQHHVISAACDYMTNYGREPICSGADLVMTSHNAYYPDERRVTFEGHTAPIRDIAISSDNNWFATASEDGTIMIWGLPPGYNE
ncbi:MAG: WD40 repeat domain-containing protein [Aggregatilineales bacterium]